MKNKPLKEIRILNKIEKIREEMHNMIKHDKGTMFDDETVVVSQHLDELIVEYLRSSGGNCRGEAQES